MISFEIVPFTQGHPRGAQLRGSIQTGWWQGVGSPIIWNGQYIHLYLVFLCQKKKKSIQIWPELLGKGLVIIVK